jgi:23S rRNA pseudouridine1911/1915/1917 synthase
MNASFVFQVNETQAGQRLDKYLADALAAYDVSRERVQQLLKEGLVTLNQQPVTKASHKMEVGYVLQVELPATKPLDLPHWNVPLDIEFEDEHILVVYKPRGMLTHPTGQQQPETLVNALLHHCKGTLSGINGVERPGIVHRLDKETEGLMVVAKTDQAHHALSQQLQVKSMRRAYYAIVQGHVQESQGCVRIGIARHAGQRNKMMADWNGKPAVTHYRVRDYLNDKFTAVECHLETGRTHQIRVHMAYLGHPLVGDLMYGTGLERAWPELPQEGQALQAFQLAFQHPVRGTSMCFQRPESDYLRQVWNLLSSRLEA